MMPAARKYQKFCAMADISAGMLHARMSKISVVRRRPSLSVITPLMQRQDDLEAPTDTENQADLCIGQAERRRM